MGCMCLNLFLFVKCQAIPTWALMALLECSICEYWGLCQ